MIKQSQQTSQEFHPELTIEAIRSTQKSRISEPMETINYEKSNLFFIKSKHVFKNYRNHQYFESQRCHQTIQGHERSTEFVEFPTPFGINNAYCFIRDEVSKNFLKNHNSNNYQGLIHANSRYDGKEKSKKQQLAKKARRSTNLTLPNLNELPTQSIIFKPVKLERLRSSQQLDLKHRNSLLQAVKEIQISQTSKLQAKFNSKQYNITVIYANKFQSLQKFGSIEIKVNIYEYIIKTFLKTKINYLELSNEQFNFLLEKIVPIFVIEKEIISFKDIVNCKNVKEIFEILAQYNESSSQFKEIIRYFFVANEQVYTYQFNCIKDEIRFLINQQTNSVNNDQKIFLFDIKKGKLITNLIELIKYNIEKFIAGIAENAYDIYQSFEKEKNSKKNAEQRVRKWKSIVPTETQIQSETRYISQDKYQTLFINAQKKRGNLQKSKRKPIISLKSRPFIERDKLIKFENIFQ